MVLARKQTSTLIEKKKGVQKEINIYINLVHDKEGITNL